MRLVRMRWFVFTLWGDVDCHLATFQIGQVFFLFSYPSFAYRVEFQPVSSSNVETFSSPLRHCRLCSHLLLCSDIYLKMKEKFSVWLFVLWILLLKFVWIDFWQVFAHQRQYLLKLTRWLNLPVCLVNRLRHHQGAVSSSGLVQIYSSK